MTLVMHRNHRALFGPAAAAILLLGIVGLAMLVPGYSQVRQTVSEIGEMDSPARIPFAALLCCVAACLLLFAAGVRAATKQAGHNPLAAYLIGCMAISAAGVGVFAFPHPLHNIFGQSELIGYQAPLALALAWRNDPQAERLVRFSWIWFVLVWICIALNLTTLHRHGPVWATVQPIYGLIQRSLFVAWFGWATGVGLMLWRPGNTSLARHKYPQQQIQQ
jgi:hypothetical membrane protein